MAVGLIPTTCWSAVFWNEATQGDLSGNRSAPTSLTLSLGSNDLFATTQGGDLEYLTIKVPEGQLLSSLFLRSYSGNDGTAFIGIQTGSTFTESPSSPNVANLLGWAHFGTGPGNVSTDILPQIGSGGGAQGFVPPLPADSYTLWIQQLGQPTTYQLGFEVTPVPEPESASICAAALLLAAWLIRGKRRRGDASLVLGFHQSVETISRSERQSDNI
jgi:hypothetical protein